MSSAFLKAVWWHLFRRGGQIQNHLSYVRFLRDSLCRKLLIQEGQHPLTGQRAANFMLLANKWAERRLVTQWRHGCRAMRRSAWNAGASNAGRSLCVQISRERSYPLPIYWYHSKGNWLRYNFAVESFYIMKLCSRLFVFYCRNCPKDDKFRYFIPHFEEVRGGVEPWLMARWKARGAFVLSVIEFFIYLLRLRR